jgi:hypothetical protein
MDNWLRVVIAVLATWRVAHLVAHEDGPGDLLARIRRGVKHQGLSRMLDCVFCSSLWLAAPVALWITTVPVDWLLTAIAISGGASLIERGGREPLAIPPLDPSAFITPGRPDREEPHHELLRTDQTRQS